MDCVKINVWYALCTERTVLPMEQESSAIASGAAISDDFGGPMNEDPFGKFVVFRLLRIKTCALPCFVYWITA